jgi:hypothetical protein
MIQRRSFAAAAAFLAASTLFLAFPGPASSSDETPVLTGRVSRERIERAVPGWVGQTVRSTIDEDAAKALTSVPPGARVTVFLGTWCSDSRREVSRFWRDLDQVGGMVPFDVTYVAVNRAKTVPADLLAGRKIEYVPTFIVERGGHEVGRVVEEAPDGIEVDLLALLTGEKSGVLGTGA